MSTTSPRRWTLAASLALLLSMATGGCGPAESGSVDLSRQPVGIENEVHDANAPAPKTPAKAPARAPKAP